MQNIFSSNASFHSQSVIDLCIELQGVLNAYNVWSFEAGESILI